MPTTIFEEKKIWPYDEYLNLPVDLNIYEIIQGGLYTHLRLNDRQNMNILKRYRR